MTNKETEETDLLLTFYGDDFTGSTDSLEGLADNGVRAILFPNPPSPADLKRFDGVDAIGIAGASRSMTPEEMSDELTQAFEALADLDPPIVHYKVCSTFDSAPEIGSIGRAIDLGQEVFDSPVVPISQGTEIPNGRYVVFSNLFAVHDDETYRIDRHPIMQDHPVTPMQESDLKRHLGKQTDRPIGHVFIQKLDTYDKADVALDTVGKDNEIIVFDAINTDHLNTIGQLFWDRAIKESDPFFVVGSSGLEHHALVHAWDKAKLIDRDERLYRKREPVERLLVVSGSASPTTAAQIDWAIEHGFRGIRLDTAGLIDTERNDEVHETAVKEAVDALSIGQSVVLYSARGPKDPAIDETRRQAKSQDVDGSLEIRLGRQQGAILGEIVEKTSLRRACIAGGDTSSHAIQELDVRALEAIAPVGPGGPLCRIHADRTSYDALEIALKGGQVCTQNNENDYFGVVRKGGISER